MTFFSYLGEKKCILLHQDHPLWLYPVIQVEGLELQVWVEDQVSATQEHNWGDFFSEVNSHFFQYSYLSNKRVGYDKRVGWKIHPTRSTSR